MKIKKSIGYVDNPLKSRKDVRGMSYFRHNDVQTHPFD
jgi:hypothetical protein